MRQRVKKTSDYTGRLAWISSEKDPALHSAIEEICLRERSEDFLILWVNPPSLHVGKNQNLWAQVSAREAYHSGISLNRRLSGGGTVYHDEGNLNFSLISTGEPKIAFCEHLHFLTPYFEARSIPVEIRNRSDLFCHGRKFSGNAEYFSGGRVLHHGTLLFQTDLEKMQRHLTSDARGYEDRAVDSNRSQTRNLAPLLPNLSNVYEFAEDLLRFLTSCHPDLERVEQPPANIMKSAQSLRPNFLDPEWVLGRSPKYQFQRKVMNNGDTISSCLTVERGRITDIELSCDNHRIDPLLQQIEEKLPNCLHTSELIHDQLSVTGAFDFREFDLRETWLPLFF